MVISYIMGGIGNQLWQYAAGRRLAHKLNTEFKIDLAWFNGENAHFYGLDLFNITAPLATPEEIERLKKISSQRGIEIEKNDYVDYPDDVYLHGYWENEKYFSDVSDIIRQEFTLKNPLSATAQHWKEKILAAECSVSLHVRHGDFAYNPNNIARKILFAILPLDYYYECVNRLKQQYTNLTVFVFSNDILWCKSNIHLGVPTEYVSGGGMLDVEELHLMSLCKHNICANSTFSWWGAWLNQNPDKKVFFPIPSNIVGTNETYRNFSAERDENSPLDSDRWIRVPFDPNKQPLDTMRPYFSLLLVVNDDAATLGETLGSILAQDYKFFELIIIDNASTDDSGEICRQAVKISDKVTMIKLWNKVPNGIAWNKALEVAQGDSVLFLKGNDRLFANALSSLYLTNEHSLADVVSSTVWLREDESGDISIADRKFVAETDAAFLGLQGRFRAKFDKPTLFKVLATNEGATPLAAKVFKRKFLKDNAIRFNEKFGDDAELLFVTEAMFKTEEIVFVPDVFYIAPKKI